MSPRLIQVFEFEEIQKGEPWPSRTDIERIERLNRVLGKEVFTRTWRGVKATNYVGVVRVGDIIIEILPKIYSDRAREEGTRVYEAAANLLFMLSYTRNLGFLEAGIAALKRFRGSLYDAIIYLFSRNLLDLLKKNYRRDYVRVVDELRYIKGRILVSREARKIVHEKTWCSYYEYTGDNLLNRVLKYVSRRLLEHARGRNWVILQNILAILDDVRDVPVTLKDIDRAIAGINRLTQDYLPFLELSKLFLSGMTLELRAHATRAFTLLFDMNKLFEDFIGTVIRRYKRDLFKDLSSGENIEVYLQTSGLIREHLLYRISNNSRVEGIFSLIPDIIIKKKKSREPPLLIIDTKYKRLDAKDKKLWGVKGEDAYQMYAYGNKYNCKNIILLYPHTEELGKNPGVIETLYYDRDRKFKLTIATVDLRKNFNNREEFNKLIANLKNIVNSSLK